MTQKKEDEFLNMLEKNIRRVLDDETLTTKDRLSAIQTGAALMEKKHKIDANKRKPGKFFKG